MRKWRPTHKCIYVIPEVHGNVESLEIILNRILPLRIFKNQEDVLVMLGDYVDGDEDGYKVIELLQSVKKEYKDRVILLKGNHEEMLIRAAFGSESDYRYWIDNNGTSTISGYLKKNEIKTSPYSISKNRLQDIIPKSHLDFIKTFEPYTVIDDYFFFHGGFNVEKKIIDNNISNFYFDNTSSKYVKDCLKNKIKPTFKDDFIFVGAHNANNQPSMYNKYFMLGGTAPQKLTVFELNSMSACAVTRGKSRIYKYDFSVCE